MKSFRLSSKKSRILDGPPPRERARIDAGTTPKVAENKRQALFAAVRYPQANSEICVFTNVVTHVIWHMQNTAPVI